MNEGLSHNADSFVVSEKEGHPLEILGVPVSSISELQSDTRILIATHPDLHREIAENVPDGIDIAGLDWECYHHIRRTINDFATEQYLKKVAMKWHVDDVIKWHLDYVVKRINVAINNTKEIIMQPSVIETNTRAFAKYKNMYEGREIALLATGPTLNRYKPVSDAIHIGVNKAYKFDKIKLDYLFVQDFNQFHDQIFGEGALCRFVSEVRNYGCVKFIGRQGIFCDEDSYGQSWDMPVSGDCVFRSSEDVNLFTICTHASTNVYTDICKNSLFQGGSIVFPALQFALYTHPKRIYLVGNDGAVDNKVEYFDGQSVGKEVACNLETIFNSWKIMKNYMGHYYPDIEIVSINPIMLKGFFQDIEM
jgi:hypothetical protein